MNEFVDECCREWRRLGVPDPVASEMAADLTADLEEAEAEGGSPEDVLGNSAFDPRRFAASWAAARGVTSAPTPDRPSAWRPPIAIALGVLLAVLTLGAGLALVSGRSGSSIAFATRRIVPGPGPLRRFIIPRALGLPVVGTQVTGVNLAPLVLLAFIVGVVVVGLFAAWYWSPWFGPRRSRRHGPPRTPGWN